MTVTSSATKPLPENEHLKQLRDHLSLPFNTLKGDTLVFSLAGDHVVIARCLDDTHLVLICELGKVDAIPEKNWRTLAVSLSAIYDREFPASLLTVEGQLGVIWTTRSDIDAKTWLTLAQGALSWVAELVKEG